MPLKKSRMTRDYFDTMLQNPYFKNARITDMKAFEMVVVAVVKLEAAVLII
jgi:hypothetical protein